jgi:ribokinase
MREGVDTSYIVKDPVLPSGVALITVDGSGENSIVVAPGSNGNLLVEDIPEVLLNGNMFEILLLQLEIPVGTVEYAAVKGMSNGMKVILNPAPAQPLSADLLKNVWLITPNEAEAEFLTGVSINDIYSAGNAASILQDKGVKNVIITLGGDGAYVKSDTYTGMIPGIKVNAIDTTAAGDIFNGALVVALSEGRDLRDAVIYANKAASISVTRLGAQASAPYRNEVN